MLTLFSDMKENRESSAWGGESQDFRLGHNVLEVPISHAAGDSR